MPDFLVFTSYAQLDRDQYLERFIADFRRELQVLTAIPDTKQLVFFDRDGVAAGDRWSQKILNTINVSDILLCLMSPAYFTRDWCARELEAFLRRMSRLQPTAAQSRFIFPVWWQVPVTPRPLPARLSQYHYRDAQFPPAYESAGIRPLARQRRWAQVQRIAGRLAEVVARTHAEPHRLPPGVAVRDILEITNAFDEQQPYDVRMLALTPGGDAWVPSTSDQSIGDAATETARRLQVFIRRIETGPKLLERLRTAQGQSQVLLMIADAAQPPDQLVKRINRAQLSNIALLLVDATTPTVGADSWFARLPSGSFSQARDAGLMRVALAGEMRPQIERLIDEARRKLIGATPPLRVEDAELAQKALTSGISINQQPNLVGPGADR